MKKFIHNGDIITKEEFEKSGAILAEVLDRGIILSGDKDESVQLVIDSIISIIRKGDLATAQQTLIKYDAYENELQSYINKKQWTPNLLLKLDPSDVISKISKLSKDNLLLFFISLPENISKELLSNLPEKIAKEILLDELSLKSDGLRISSHESICKISWGILNELQTDYKQGKIEFTQVNNEVRLAS